jgi:hypothetical protein
MAILIVLKDFLAAIAPVHAMVDGTEIPDRAADASRWCGSAEQIGGLSSESFSGLLLGDSCALQEENTGGFLTECGFDLQELAVILRLNDRGLGLEIVGENKFTGFIASHSSSDTAAARDRQLRTGWGNHHSFVVRRQLDFSAHGEIAVA